MKVKVVDVWEGVTADINVSSNGKLTTKNFNIWLKRTEIFLIHFLTGNITNAGNFPMPYEKQKCKDYLKNFIAKKAYNNEFDLPDDYYQWDNLFRLGAFNKAIDCKVDEIVEEKNCDIVVELMDGQEFKSRCTSEIEELVPSLEIPICKIVNNRVETEPKEIGSMRLEYIRYPKFGKLVMKKDPAFNTEVVDEAASGELEWDIWALEFLIWSIIDLYSKRVSNKTLKEFNTTNKPE